MALDTYATNYTSETIKQTLPALLTPIICQEHGGELLLMQPASSSTCSKTSNAFKNINREVCDSFPPEKKGVCGKALDIMDRRLSECFGGIFSGDYSNSRPAPEMEGYCNELRS